MWLCMYEGLILMYVSLSANIIMQFIMAANSNSVHAMQYYANDFSSDLSYIVQSKQKYSYVTKI